MDAAELSSRISARLSEAAVPAAATQVKLQKAMPNMNTHADVEKLKEEVLENLRHLAFAPGENGCLPCLCPWWVGVPSRPAEERCSAEAWAACRWALARINVGPQVARSPCRTNW